jgi:phage baseplate assembly protein W
MYLFGLIGPSAEALLNNLGGWRKIASNTKFNDDLKVLLETRKGTLIGDPSFGSNLHELLFEPANNATASLIRHEVAHTIEEHFGNISIESVDVTFRPYTIRLDIAYTFISTNVGDTAVIEFIRGNVSV